jgi:hypothetical protein
MFKKLFILTLIVLSCQTAHASDINANMRAKNSDGNWVDLSVDSNGYVKVIGA